MILRIRNTHQRLLLNNKEIQLKKDSGQLHGELMSSLYQFTKDIGYHLPPDKIFDTTTSLIDLFVSYERYRESIISETSKHLEDKIGELPIEKQKKIKRNI